MFSSFGFLEFRQRGSQFPNGSSPLQVSHGLMFVPRVTRGVWVWPPANFGRSPKSRAQESPNSQVQRVDSSLTPLLVDLPCESKCLANPELRPVPRLTAALPIRPGRGVVQPEVPEAKGKSPAEVNPRGCLKGGPFNLHN